MWSGSVATIPAGWAFCNGSNGTPDLRDRFIVGAKQDVAGVAKTQVTGSLTQTGGNVGMEAFLDSPYLSAGELIADSYPYGSYNADLAGSVVYTYGAQDSSNTLPVYYALAFIMKL